MKLEDIKPPKGFVIRGYEKPSTGDYILCPDNTFDIAAPACANYQSFCIVLDKVPEPEIGKYYEFSDLPDFTCSTSLGVYTGKSTCTAGREQYFTEKGTGWLYIRPVKGELGK